MATSTKNPHYDADMRQIDRAVAASARARRMRSITTRLDTMPPITAAQRQELLEKVIALRVLDEPAA